MTDAQVERPQLGRTHKPLPVWRGTERSNPYRSSKESATNLTGKIEPALASRGVPDVLREIRERMAGRPTYLCFDMDFFDPSCAPGVCTPAWGGVSASEGLALIAALEGLRFVAFDINTVSPPHDVGGMTAFLAASCLHQFLILLCKQLRLTQP